MEINVRIETPDLSAAILKLADAIAPKAVDARTGQGQARGAKPLTQEESLRTRYLRQQRQLRGGRR